jgi:hypothetical protein
LLLFIYLFILFIYFVVQFIYLFYWVLVNFNNEFYLNFKSRPKSFFLFLSFFRSHFFCTLKIKKKKVILCSFLVQLQTQLNHCLVLLMNGSHTKPPFFSFSFPSLVLQPSGCFKCYWAQKEKIPRQKTAQGSSPSSFTQNILKVSLSTKKMQRNKKNQKKKKEIIIWKMKCGRGMLFFHS